MSALGLILAWVGGISGLVILIIIYKIFMPILNFMIHVTTQLGAPAANAQFIGYCAVWTFILLAVICVIYPFIYTYKVIYDQGTSQRGLI